MDPRSPNLRVNMVHESPGIIQNVDIRTMNVDLVALHSRQSQHHNLPLHDYSVCSICSKDNQGCYFVQEALQRQMDLSLDSRSPWRGSLSDQHGSNFRHSLDEYQFGKITRQTSQVKLSGVT